MSDDNRILVCGHRPSPHSSVSTGTAHTPGGREICWDCAHAEQVAELKAAKRYSVYVGDKVVTDWTGRKLGDILSQWATMIFGNKGFAYVVRDVHGQQWHGRHAGMFSGKGMILNIRRAK